MGLGRMLSSQALKRATGGRIQQPNRFQALIRLPTLLRLGYALFRDERVPLWQRAATVGLLALIFSPVDIVGYIPMVGQVWDFTVSVVVLEQFIRFAPAEVVNEHIVRLKLEKSIPLRRI